MLAIFLGLSFLFAQVSYASGGEYYYLAWSFVAKSNIVTWWDPLLLRVSIVVYPLLFIVWGNYYCSDLPFLIDWGGVYMLELFLLLKESTTDCLCQLHEFLVFYSQWVSNACWLGLASLPTFKGKWFGPPMALKTFHLCIF